MNRKDYKRLMNPIEPDDGMKQRIVENLNHRSQDFNINKTRGKSGMNRVLNAAAGVAVIACLGLVIALTWNSVDAPVISSNNPGPEVSNVNDPNTVTVPKIELPDETDVMANIIGLIVYKGNIYTQSATSITPEVAKQLRGNQLGRTKSGIHERSTSSDYTELASTIGEMDVFSVKGYDTDFRIMSYLEMDGQIFAEFYEHLNNITISKGKDIIGKLNLIDHIGSVKWQNFNSRNNSANTFTVLQVNQILERFITALYEAKPIAGDQLYKAGIYGICT